MPSSSLANFIDQTSFILNLETINSHTYLPNKLFSILSFVFGLFTALKQWKKNKNKKRK